jgi:hypothetical protein
MLKKVVFSRRSIFLVTFLSFFLSCILFRGAIFHFALKKYLSHKIPLSGDWDFNYSSLSLETSGVSFHDIDLRSKSGGMICRVGKIFCKAPLLEKVCFSNHFEIEDLDLTFEKKLGGKSALSRDQMRLIVSTLLQVEIKSGAIHIPSYDMSISLDKSISSQKLGKMVFSKMGEGQVKLDLSLWGDQLIVDVEARQSTIAFYKAFVDFFMGGDLSNWKMDKGRLDGRAFFVISSTNQIEDVRVHMSCLEGKFTNPIAGITSSFDRLFVDINYPLSTECNSIIENISCISSVDKGDIIAFDEKGTPRFSFKDLSGFITMDAFKKAAVEISGFIEDGNRLMPIQLVGKPISSSESGLELDLSLQLDPVFAQQAHVHVLCSHSDDTFFIKSRLDSLQVKQMWILQVGLGLIDSSFKEYTLSKGSYSGDVEMQIGYHGIKDFCLKNLSCEDLCIYSEKRDIQVEAQRISGECHIDLFKEKATTLPGWKMKIEDCSLTVGREKKPPLYFEKGAVFVSAVNGEFFDTYFTGEINGIKGRVFVEGSILSPIFDVMLTASGNDLLQWFKEPKISYEMELSLSSRIEKKGKIYCGLGNLNLIHDHQTHEILFNSTGTDLSDLIIDFSTKKLPSKVFPFINELFQFQWSLEGCYGCIGKYTPQGVALDIEGKNCSYYQGFSFIENAKGIAHFEHDFTHGNWFIDIFLSEGKKTLFQGGDFVLEGANIKVSSQQNFCKIRGLEGYIQGGSNFPRLKIQGAQYDIFDNGDIHFDGSFHNEFIELGRVSGKIKDREIVFNEHTHFLDRPIHFSKCTFKEGILVDLEYCLSTKDPFYPRFFKEQGINDVGCSFSLNNDSYLLSMIHNGKNIVLKGIGSDFTVICGDRHSVGKLENEKILLKGGGILYNDLSIDISTLDLSRDSFSFDGTIKHRSSYFEGSILGKYKSPFCFEGKGVAGTQWEGVFIDAVEPFSFKYEGKGEIYGGIFEIKDKEKKVGKVSATSISFEDPWKRISLHGLSGEVKKDFLSERYGVHIFNETLGFCADADIYPDQRDFWFSGAFKKETFFFLDRELSINDIYVRANTKTAAIDCQLPLFEKRLDLSSHLYFDEIIHFKIDGRSDNKEILEVDGRYDGEIEILRMKGALAGIDFDLTPSHSLEENAFKGKVAFDLQTMKPLLSEGVAEFVDRLKLGKGIEVIGDLYYMDGLCFNGVIKGTDFDCMGACLSTLFGSIHLERGVCTLKDFSIADRSMMAFCPLATFDASSKGCLFDAKTFKIEHLRPCLMSKKGERNKLSNPFMIESLEFFDLKGDLENVDTLTGKGEVYFTNSFDQQKNPILGLAKEIIGRIGLDPVLMIPVVGEIDFSIADGKIHLLKMQNSYSDRKRSYFYLWNKSQSYIDFDGNIHIDIRMKQYALFKFAELFIISLEGSLSSPRIHLK